MIWAKRILLTLPFAIALSLTILVEFAAYFHMRGERAAGLGFLFATPWGWLLDLLWIPTFHNHVLERIMGYFVVLWISAALYSVSFWIIGIIFVQLARRLSDGWR